MRHPVRLVALAALALLASVANAVPGAIQGFDMRVLHPPSAYRMKGRVTLLYELVLTNVSSSPLELQRVEVIEPGSGRILASRSGVDLGEATGLVGDPESRGRLLVPAGRSAIVYMDVAVPPGLGTPRGLRHRVTFHGENGEATVGGAETTVAGNELPRLGPPLRGGLWAAVYDHGLERGHRRYLYATSGRAVIPGRHAIDWMAVGPKTADGEGSEVVAVADGLVVASRDGVTGSNLSGSLDEGSGNFLAIDIGHGFTAFYEHLRPGLAVRPGDRVVRGQTIGWLGSSGQARRPHLHFHVASGTDPLAADGLPYILEGFTIVGAYRDVEAASANAQWSARFSESGSRSDLPPANTVVRFDR